MRVKYNDVHYIEFKHLFLGLHIVIEEDRYGEGGNNPKLYMGHQCPPPPGHRTPRTNPCPSPLFLYPNVRSVDIEQAG